MADQLEQRQNIIRGIYDRNRVRNVGAGRLNVAPKNIPYEKPAQQAFIAHIDKGGRPSNKQIAVIPLKEKNSLLFPQPTSESEILATFATVVDLMNVEGDNGPTKAQIVAYYLSLVCMTFTDTRQEAFNYLQGKNFMVQPLLLPDDAENEFIMMSEEISYDDWAINFGQLMLLLYKNVTEVNYTRFMQARIKAMTAKAGRMWDGSVDVLLTFRAAQAVKATVGQDRELKISMLKGMKANQGLPAPFGPIMAYVLDIIEWTDMNYMNFINQHIVIPMSPVLSDPVVAPEVNAYARAIRLVVSQPEPQFYRIVADATDTNRLNRNNFRMLLAVAMRIALKTSPTLENFVGSTQVNETEVARLVRLHEASGQDYTHPETNNNLEYLLGRGVYDNELFDFTEEVEEPAEGRRT